MRQAAALINIIRLKTPHARGPTAN